MKTLKTILKVLFLYLTIIFWILVVASVETIPTIYLLALPIIILIQVVVFKKFYTEEDLYKYTFTDKRFKDEA